MTSRERVMAAAQRRRPDRPPTSLRCTPEASQRLCRHLGVGTEQEMLDLLDIDLRWIGVPFIGPAERSTPTLGGEGTDFLGVRYKRVANPFNTYYEFDYHPLAEAKTVADVESYDWPSVEWWDYSALPRVIEQANCTGPRALVIFAGGSFESPWYMRGMEQFLMDLHEQPEIAEAISRRVTEFYYQRALRIIDAAGHGVHVMLSGGDIGEQNRMLISPEVWRRHIKPYSTRLIRPFKEMGYITLYHSDGAITPVIDDLIGMGLDVLDPIQVRAAGMSPEELFPRFGDRLSFHGAIDEQHLLPQGTPAEVYEATQRTIDVLGRNGGYIVSAAHALQGDTPPENVLAMLEAAKGYRW